MKILLKKILCVLALAACLCAPIIGGGSGTNTGNGVIAGKIVDQSGKSIEGVGIRLRPSDYLQAPPWKNALMANSEIRETMTGPDGSFTIDSLPEGTYSVEANDNRGHAVLLKCSVIQDEPAATLAQAALEPYATITGKVAAAPSGARRYVQIYGLERCAAADSNGNYTLGNLPAGVFTLRIICSDTAVAPITIPSQQAISGAVTQTPPEGWLFSKKIHFNTTAGGAAVTGNVLDFPLLIRLTAANFDFAQARNKGEDIRFAKRDNTFLPYEIECWDAVAKLAEVWVKVDTVFGSDSSQAITMYWDNVDAAGQSNSAAVFDTGSGFQGVWHLSDPSGSVAVDATANGYNGAPRGSAPPGSAQGIIGNANVFNGADFIEMPGTAAGALNFPQHGTYCLSAWVNVDSLAGEYQMIASKGDKQYNLQFKGATKNWQFTEYQDTIGWDETVSGAVVRSWVYLVGVRSNEKQYLYVNGECADSVIYNLPYSASDSTYAERQGYRNTTCNFMIGKKVDYSAWFFKGSIDEVRVSSRAQSPDWIKLCYMNQKSVDMLVVFQK